MSPFHVPFSKSRLVSFKHSQWCLAYLSTNLFAALVPSDTPRQPFHDTPQGEVTQLFQTCFSFFSAPGPSYSYREWAPHPQGWQNCCTVAARWPHTLKLNQVSGTRAGSCSRWTTGRWHLLAVKDTVPMVGAGLTLLCLKSPNPRVLPQEIQQHLLAIFHCRSWHQSHEPLHPQKTP